MTCYDSKFIRFSKELMEKQGEEIKRWANDPIPIIANEFKAVIAAAGAHES